MTEVIIIPGIDFFSNVFKHTYIFFVSVYLPIISFDIFKRFCVSLKNICANKLFILLRFLHPTEESICSDLSSGRKMNFCIIGAIFEAVVSPDHQFTRKLLPLMANILTKTRLKLCGRKQYRCRILVDI